MDSDCDQGTCLAAFVSQPQLAPIGVCLDLGVAVCGPYPGYVPPLSLERIDAGSHRDAATSPDGG